MRYYLKCRFLKRDCCWPYDSTYNIIYQNGKERDRETDMYWVAIIFTQIMCGMCFGHFHPRMDDIVCNSRIDTGMLSVLLGWLYWKSAQPLLGWIESLSPSAKRIAAVSYMGNIIYSGLPLIVSICTFSLLIDFIPYRQRKYNKLQQIVTRLYPKAFEGYFWI